MRCNGYEVKPRRTIDGGGGPRGGGSGEGRPRAYYPVHLRSVCERCFTSSGSKDDCWVVLVVHIAVLSFFSGKNFIPRLTYNPPPPPKGACDLRLKKRFLSLISTHHLRQKKKSTASAFFCTHLPCPLLAGLPPSPTPAWSLVQGVLQQDDILLAIDGQPVGLDGMVPFGGSLETRMSMWLPFFHKLTGDACTFRVRRRKRELDVRYTLRPYRPVIPEDPHCAGALDYFLVGGLVFQPVSRMYLEVPPLPSRCTALWARLVPAGVGVVCGPAVCSPVVCFVSFICTSVFRRSVGRLSPRLCDLVHSWKRARGARGATRGARCVCASVPRSIKHLFGTDMLLLTGLDGWCKEVWAVWAAIRCSEFETRSVAKRWPHRLGHSVGHPLWCWAAPKRSSMPPPPPQYIPPRHW